MRPTRPGRPGPRLLAVLFVLLLAAGGLACSGNDPDPPPKPPVAGSVLEWNLSGFSQHRGSAVPVDALMARLQTMPAPPVAIVLVELCSSQYELFRDRLSAAPLAYRSASAWSIASFGQPSCASYGNAVFWQGEAEPNGVASVTFPDDLQINGPRTQEKRNVLCTAFRTPETPTAAATPLRICATHLHQLPAVGEKQLAVVQTLVDRHNAGGGVPTMLAGDLNLLPMTPALAPWYAGAYLEADLTDPLSARPTTRTNRKLDYVFVPAATMHVPRPADLAVVPESDHAIYTGHVAVHG